MDERDWMVLKTLYDEKNITKAAQQLFISQPALTHRLQQLEQKFNVKIVVRGRRGVQFTPQGEYLAQCAIEMLAKFQQIKENVLNMDYRVEGVLKLGVSNFFTDYKLPNLLKRFKEQYPHVEFKVRTDFSSEIAHLIYNQDVHVGFVKGEFGWKEQKRLLFEEELCIASKDKIAIDDLPSLPRIDYRTDPLLKTYVDNWWYENFSQPSLVSIEVDKVDTCKKMVVNGLGYAIVPTMILSDVEDVHKIIIKTKDGMPIIRKTWMFFHEESLQLNVVKAFVNFVEQLNLEEGI